MNVTEFIIDISVINNKQIEIKKSPSTPIEFMPYCESLNYSESLKLSFPFRPLLWSRTLVRRSSCIEQGGI